MSEAEKRSVSTDALHTLGTIIGPEEKRDAIHLAVIPAKAAHTLQPGADVGYIGGKTNPPVMGFCDEPLGIVDPFLKNLVAKDQFFWLVIYPRKIDSLRHVWSHAEFPEEAIVSPKPIISVSRAWLDNYAVEIDVTYNSLIANTNDYVATGSYWSEGGKFEGTYLPDEFWEHYQKETGNIVPANKQESFFSCSC